MRKRLLSIVGALGLMTGLLSSGVAAQAATTAGPDSTYNTMLAIFSWSSHDVCYSNGTFITPANPCVISQGGGQRNIAVCVQNGNSPVADEQCDITQSNNTRNNYALVIQRINQQSAATTSCPTVPPTLPPCQLATQRASIVQDATTTGSNFGGVIQKVTQSLTEQPTDNDPKQDNTQDVKPATGFAPGLKQTSGTGSNFAAVGQDSQQYQAGAIAQTQNASQSAGQSGFGDGINQGTTAPGGNAAVLGQVQKQNLQSQVAKNQSEHATQDGDITQTGGAGNFHNRASGNQFQDQQEHGVVGVLGVGTSQVQIGDPRCCSSQFAGGQFPIVQVTNQFANNALLRQQSEFILGNCVSPPSGCTLRQSATVNGTPTPGVPCTAKPSCSEQISCFTGGGCVAGPPNTGLLRFSRRNLALRGRATANAALLT